MLNSKIIGSGSYLPANCVLNDALPKELETSDAWISERTGIKQRYIASDDTYTSDLATGSLKDAMDKANISASDLDGVIVATCTPDSALPSVAISVCKNLGIKSVFAFDINAACSGFIYGLSVADSLIKNKTAKRIAVIGAETMTRIVDWKDRSTCVLFGDGAGAFILEGTQEDVGIIDSSIESDATNKEILYVPTDKDSKLFMNGREVYKQAIDKMYSSVVELCEKSNISLGEIDWFLPHQANQRILLSLADKMKVSPTKIISTVDKHANTSAASIPLAFDEYLNAGKIKKGQLIALTAFGAGLAWGSCIIRY